MDKITQTARYKQFLILYAQKHGVTKAAIRCHTNRQYIYRWSKRYDGTLKSLEDRSHHPHSHPNQHRPEEIKPIQDMRRRNPNAGLVVFWVKLRQRDYTRSISGLYHFLRKSGQMAVKLPNPKYIPKPYEQMRYPGQRVQIDVKYVPKNCLSVPLPSRVDTTSTPFWMNTAVFSIWRHSRSTALIFPLNSSGTASENSPLPLSAFRQTTVLNLPTGKTPWLRKCELFLKKLWLSWESGTS